MSANHLAHVITEAISPYVGQMMARTSIELHCKRLGVDPDSLGRAHLDPLLQQLSLGLNVFIGREKAEAVIGELRVALGKVK